MAKDINANRYFDTDIWEPVPMISREIIEKGYEGGEGCQACLYITCDPIDGTHWLMGTDVGGMYRSDDGGVHWTPSAIGYEGCGCTGFAFDPNNINKVLGLGVNSWGCPQNGIYMSNDKGLTWQAIMQTNNCGFRDLRNQFAFDETSYDEKIGGSAVVYWAREGSRNNFNRGDTLNDPGIYKSTDGGYTWTKLADTEMMGDANIYVHKEKGWLFVICPTGFYRSKDKGESFEKLRDDEFTFADCIRSYPDRIYATTKEGLFVSYNCGDSFSLVETDNFPAGYPSALRVSPVNPDKMVLQDDRLTLCGNWNMPVYSTADGGKTWTYICWSGHKWGGWTYGGYTFNDDVTFCGLADRMFGATKVAVTYDGGKTVTKTDMDIHGVPISCGVPGNDKVAFIGDLVTRDTAQTFERMEGCTGVITYDHSGTTLFGVCGDSTIVMSTDEGRTWTKVFFSDGARISDMAYNYKSGYLYFTNWGSLNKIKLDGSDCQKLDYPSKHASSVCIDPENPDIMYLGCSSNAEFGMPNVLRSLDAGEKWTVLTRMPNDGRKGPDGAKQASQLRVNPLTRELFVICGCRGVWKIKCCPPDAKNE